MTNITIKTITLENIKGVKNLNVNLNNHHIFRGKNGVGKTTMLDSICWLLTGSKDMFNKIFDPTSYTIPKEKSQSATIELLINEETHLFEISRPNQNESLEYYHNGKKLMKSYYLKKLSSLKLDRFALTSNPNYVLSCLNIKDARTQVVELIPRVKESEVRSYLLSLNYSMEQINELNYAGNWDKETINHRRNSLKHNIRAQRTSIDKFNDQITLSNKARLPKLIARKGTLIKNLEKINDSSLEKISKQQSIIKESMRLTNIKWRVLLGRNEKISDEFMNVKNELEQRESEIKESKSIILAIKNDNSVKYCQTCSQPIAISENKKESDIQRIEEKIKTNTIRVQELNTKLVEVLESLRTMSENESKILELQSTEQDFIKELDSLNFQYNAILENSDKITKERELESIRQEIASIKGAETLESMIKQTNYNIITLKKSLKYWENINLLCDVAIEFENETFKRNAKKYFGNEFELIITKTLKNGKMKNIFTVSYNNVPFDNLNYGRQLTVGIHFCLGVQKMLGISVPILLDNIESISHLEVESRALIIGAEVISG